MTSDALSPEYIPCACGDHHDYIYLCLDDWAGELFVGMNMRPLGWRQRLKALWDVLRGHEVLLEDVVLSQAAALRLVALVNRWLDGQAERVRGKRLSLDGDEAV